MTEIKLRLNEELKNEILLKINNKTDDNIISINSNEEMEIENLFEDEIKMLKKEEIIKFASNYLIPENKINTIKKDFIEKNNFQIYNNSKHLLFSSKLFTTQKRKQYIVKTSDNDNKYYYLRDKNILITQFYENGAVYDLVYLFGEPDKKIFLGFQMKSYRDYLTKRNFPLVRKDIIEHSKLLLFNSNYLLNVNIIEMHYIIIGLYFQDETKFEQYSYSKNLITFCKNNKFNLILYEPFKKKFLDSNLKDIDEIKIPGEFTNLLEEEEIFSVYDENPRENNIFLQRKTKLILTKEIIDLTKRTKNITKQKIKVREIISFINEIKNFLKVKNLQYVGSKKFVNNNYLPTPKSDCFFFFYRNDDAHLEGLNKFYCLYKKDKETLVYDFKNNKDIKYDFICDYFSLFNKKECYYIFRKKL